MVEPVDHHTSRKDTEREGEGQAPQAGRDIERPRGGPNAVLLAIGAIVILALIGWAAGVFG